MVKNSLRSITLFRSDQESSVYHLDQAERNKQSTYIGIFGELGGLYFNNNFYVLVINDE